MAGAGTCCCCPIVADADAEADDDDEDEENAPFDPEVTSFPAVASIPEEAPAAGAAAAGITSLSICGWRTGCGRVATLFPGLEDPAAAEADLAGASSATPIGLGGPGATMPVPARGEGIASADVVAGLLAMLPTDDTGGGGGSEALVLPASCGGPPDCPAPAPDCTDGVDSSWCWRMRLCRSACSASSMRVAPPWVTPAYSQNQSSLFPWGTA